MDSHLMKMIWAVIRPERVDVVVGALKTEGFSAMTRFDVYGRGKQMGIVVAGESYDMPKTVLMLVLAPRIVQPLSWPALLVSLGVCLHVYLLALLWRRPARRQQTGT